MGDMGDTMPSSDEPKASSPQLTSLAASIGNMGIEEASGSDHQGSSSAASSASQAGNSHAFSSAISGVPIARSPEAASYEVNRRPDTAPPSTGSSGANSSPLKADAEAFHPGHNADDVNGEGPSRRVYTPPPIEHNGQVRPSADSKRPVSSTVNLDPHGNAVFFSTDDGEEAKAHGCHYAKLEGIPKAEFTEVWERLRSVYGWKHNLRGLHTMPMEGSHVVMALCFDDIHNIAQAIEDISNFMPAMRLSVINHAEYAAVSKDSNNSDGNSNDSHDRYINTHDVSNRFDGQVIFEADFGGDPQAYDVNGIAPAVKELASTYGAIIAFAMDSSAWPNVKFRVEYSCISSAKEVASAMDEHNPKDIRLNRSLPLCQNGPAAPQAVDQDWSIIAYEVSSGKHLNGALRPLHGRQKSLVVTPPQAQSQLYQASPSGRSAWYYDRLGNASIAVPPRQLPKASGSRTAVPSTPGYGAFAGRSLSNSGNYDVVELGGEPRTAARPRHTGDQGTCDPFLQPGNITGEPQHVLRWRIVEGHDVRTTVMLRNLPNFLTARGFKKILDKATFGKYDFSYLRIDFAENKNVGYGFVNFIDPSAVIEFIDAWGLQQWCPDMRDRHGVRDAKFSYATIQGYDCLIDKFRNSAVMDEFRDYRPKVWHTRISAPDPGLVGTEMEFPRPNNWSKKQRSLDNASHIGLFNSSQRTNRRTRSSQWDRGTTSQIREDAFFDQYGTPTGNGFGVGYATSNYAIAPTVFAAPPPQYGGAFYGTSDSFISNGSGVEPADPFTSTHYTGGFPGTPSASGHGAYVVGHGRFNSHHSVNAPMAGSPVPRILHTQGGNGYYQPAGFMTGFRGNGYSNHGWNNNGWGNHGYGNHGYGGNGFGNNSYGNDGYGNNGWANNGYGGNGYGNVNSGYGGWNHHGSDGYGGTVSFSSGFVNNHHGSDNTANNGPSSANASNGGSDARLSRD